MWSTGSCSGRLAKVQPGEAVQGADTRGGGLKWPVQGVWGQVMGQCPSVERWTETSGQGFPGGLGDMPWAHPWAVGDRPLFPPLGAQL